MASEQDTMGNNNGPGNEVSRRGDGFLEFGGIRKWSEPQKTVLRTLGMKDCNDVEMGALLHAAQRYKLDPFAKQITLYPGGWDPVAKAKTHSIMLTMDGYLALAERTGRYLGLRVYWCGKDGVWHDIWLSDELPAAAKCELDYVTHTGHRATAVCTALMKERIKYKKDRQGGYTNEPQAKWKESPTEMLANAAIRLAIRRGLPEAIDTIDLEVGEINYALDHGAEYTDPTTGEVFQAGTATLPPVATPPVVVDVETVEAVIVSEATPEPSVPAQAVTGRFVGEADSPTASGAQVRRVAMLTKQLGWSEAERHAWLQGRYGKTSSTTLTTSEANDAIKELQHAFAVRQSTAAVTPTVAETQPARVAPPADSLVLDGEVIDDPYEAAPSPWVETIAPGKSSLLDDPWATDENPFS